MNLPSLDDEEVAVMQDLFSCCTKIMAWGLRANQDELFHAVHVIQGFIIQHMLQRLNPAEWAEWYKESVDEHPT